MPDLLYRLQRTVVIKARPETVFRLLTDSVRWAAWWGAGSTIDARPGGKIYIRHPNGVETLGEVLEVHPPEQIVFTYGFATGRPIPRGSSRVTIRLEPDGVGTRLHLLHEFEEPAPRDEHVQGWRFQLSLFSNLVANEVFADAARSVDEWFRAWMISEEKVRAVCFARIVTPEIQFRDRFSLLEGLADLTAHAGAAQRFMPGIYLERTGDVRQCQGTVLADWIAVDKESKERMSGTSVFVFSAEAKIDSVTSFTNPPVVL
jgi:uncharacterized protein YndB with AHSA1/START domain